MPILFFSKRSMPNKRMRYGNYSKKQPIDEESTHSITVAAFGFDDYGCDECEGDPTDDYEYCD